jgi:flagellar biogenesis protein FliO
MNNIRAAETQSSIEPMLSALWTRLRSAFSCVNVRRRQRQLQLCESISLGEKRLIAVVQVDQQRFLVAATPQTISLLQALDPAPATGQSDTIVP